MARDRALSVAFFLSGAASLIFQVVWFHRAGLVLGNSVWAVTVVLSSFMAGLALGNYLAASGPRLKVSGLRLYACLEMVAATTGIGVTWLLPLLSVIVVPTIAALAESSWLVHVVRFVVAFVVLVVPATAIGATLPVLVGVVAERAFSPGVALGRLYGFNTLGAVAGVLGAELLLIDRFGVVGAASGAGLLDLGAAGIAWWISRSAFLSAVEPSAPAIQARHQPLSPTDERDRIPSVLPLVAAALSGAAFLGLEVLWFRFLTTYVLSTTLAASLMLAVVLSGIAVGGLAAAWMVRRTRLVAPPVIAFVTGAVVVLTYWAFQFVTSGTQVGSTWKILGFALALTSPASIASGMLFTVIGHRLAERVDWPSRPIAWLALANTLGGMAGAPLAAFLLLPSVGLESSLALLAGSYGLIGWFLWRAEPSRSGFTHRLVWGTGALLIVSLVLFPFGLMRTHYIPRAAATYAGDGSTVVATREGPTETILLMQQRAGGQVVYNRLVTNGFSMTGTAVPGLRYMRYFAYWPMLVHKGPLERALVICYGVGVTAGAVLQIPSLQSLDIAEISADVVAMSDAIYEEGSHPLHDPRVRLHIEDGRFFLETHPATFDLITGEPPPPRTPGTANIYTREYFERVRASLRDGGVATYWLPVGRPEPGTDVDTIVKAFCDVFDDCSLWNATPFDLMLVGTRQGQGGPVSREAFNRPWQTSGLQASLREVGFERPEQIGATFVADAAFLQTFVAGVPPLTDDFPQRLRPTARASLSDPRYGRDPAVTEHYRTLLDPDRARTRFLNSPYIRRLWPADLIEASAPYFAVQRMINDVLWEAGDPLRHVGDLNTLLTGTALRTLPLWLLGTDDVRLSIAESMDDGHGTREYARGLRGLSGRDYAGAATLFARAEARGFPAAQARALQAFALQLAGRHEEAVALGRDRRSGTEAERAFWEWLGSRG